VSTADAQKRAKDCDELKAHVEELSKRNDAITRENQLYANQIIELKEQVCSSTVLGVAHHDDSVENYQQSSKCMHFGPIIARCFSPLHCCCNGIRNHSCQVDAALGSEEMIEQLTSKNLELEEKVQKLQDEVETLDQMKDIDDEMAESVREVERELRHELDAAEGRCNEVRARSH